MKKLLSFIIITSLIINYAFINNTYATTVVEEITGSAGDWTYTYTITNTEISPIWQWAVWFPTNPNADSIGADANWSVSDLTFQGFFPEEYIAFYGDPVYDGSGTPLDGNTGNETLLAGPNGEPGFYNTYASDYTSSNSGQYWDGSSWQNLPDSLPGVGDPIYDKIWRGEDWGWMGSGANIQTIFGIDHGGTGEFTFHSAELISGTKGYSYNTIDYWYSIYDENFYPYIDFMGSGNVVPEPATWLILFLGLLGMAGLKNFLSKSRYC